MKFCKYCGAELSDDAAVCSKCGHSLSNGAVEDRSQNKLGIAGFVLSFFFVQPLALIFSIIGIAVGKKHNDKVGLAVAGLIISIISSVIVIILYGSIILPMLNEIVQQYGLATALPLL